MANPGVLLITARNEVGQGNVLTPVCHSIHKGVCHTPPDQTPPTPLGRHSPLGRHPPVQCMLGYGQQAGGTHPTGMQSC